MIYLVNSLCVTLFIELLQLICLHTLNNSKYFYVTLIILFDIHLFVYS